MKALHVRTPSPCRLGAWRQGLVAGLAAGLAALGGSNAWAAWEPTEPVELVVPAGTGGGADQMARLIARIVSENQWLKQPIQVVNQSGNSGAEGLLNVKAASGNPHKLLITLSNLFTTPLATGIDFHWKDLTPVTMLALDPFVLWTTMDRASPTARAALDEISAQHHHRFAVGGTGSKQEDQILTILLEAHSGKKLRYVPLKGGGDVAKALAEKQVDFTVNNPIEAEKLWGEGRVRPLCVFRHEPLASTADLSGGRHWHDIPPCMATGIPIEYQMLRGIFMAPGVTPEQQAFFTELMVRVRAQPDWQNYIERGALTPSTMSGPTFVRWLDRAASFHRLVMRESKLMPPDPAINIAPSTAASSPALVRGKEGRSKP